MSVHFFYKIYLPFRLFIFGCSMAEVSADVSLRNKTFIYKYMYIHQVYNPLYLKKSIGIHK